MSKKLLLLALLFGVLGTSKTNAQWRHYGLIKIGKLSFDVYAKRASWGLGQQFIAANVSSSINKKIHVQGQFTATLTCGNQVSSELFFKLQPGGQLIKLDPAEEGNQARGHLVDNTGLLWDAQDTDCKGDEIMIGGKKYINRISSLAIKVTKITTEDEEGNEIELNSNGEPLKPSKKEEEKKKKEEEEKVLVEKKAEESRQKQEEERQRQEEAKRKEEEETQNRFNQSMQEIREKEEAARIERARREEQDAKNIAAVGAGVAAAGLGVLSSGIAPDYAFEPSFVLEGNFGLGVINIPAVQNEYSFPASPADVSKSDAFLAFGLGGNCKIWPIKSENFGLAAVGSLFYPIPMSSDNSSGYTYSLGGRALLGFSRLKGIFDFGMTTRNGSSMLINDRYTIFSNGTYGSNKVFIEQKFDYTTNKLGFGLMYEFEEDLKQCYINFMFSRENIDFIKNDKPVYSYKLEFRYILDIELEYSRNYAVAGIPLSPFQTAERNKDFIQVSFGFPLGYLVEY